MRRPFFLLVLLLTSAPAWLYGQKRDEFKQPRILILLDGSSSMLQPWTPGKERFKAASDIILSLMDSIYQVNDQVEFALRVYGHQFNVPENNCFDTKREVMFSKNNYTQMALRLASLNPMGVSPIAYSLKTAAENDFIEERDYSYSMILITDGGESCGGDICDIVKTLLDKKIQFRPYIVSLVDYEPLRTQYDCLGNYLKVSKPSEMAPALHTITENYRKVLAIPVAKPKKLDVTTLPMPSVLKIEVPTISVPKREAETTTVAPKPVVPAPVVSAPPKAEIKQDPPKPKPAEPAATVPPPAPKKMVVDQAPFIKEQIASLRKQRLYPLPVYFAAPKPKAIKIPALKIPKREPDPVATVAAPPVKPAFEPAVQKTNNPVPSKPKPVIAPPPPKPVKEASYTATSEPASKSSVQVYFTDGKGKFYKTNPKILLLDPKTGKTAHKFFRTVNAAGEPDLQDVPPGAYTLTFEAQPDLIVKNIVVQENENRKIIIKVGKGSIKFEYEGNTKRPVSEFDARVKRLFEYSPIAIQHCTELIEYEPGNYHVDLLGTLPEDSRNFDIGFGETVVIRVDEPGFVRFANSNSLGKISLWFPLGDQFVRFYAMEITGNPEAQTLRLQPGTYEVRFKRNPRLPSTEDVITRFVVKSNATTELTLQ